MFAGYDLSAWVQVTTIATPVITLLAVAAVIFQVRSSANDAAESAADSMYRTFLEQALVLPEFVVPDEKKLNTAKLLYDRDPIKFQKYEVFVDLMLATADYLFLHSKNIEYMDDYIRAQKTYLTSPYWQHCYRKQVEPELWKYISDILNRPAKWEIFLKKERRRVR